MPNLPLQENFRKNKKKFFQQQSFDDNCVLKKWSAFIGAILVIYETIMYQVIIPKVFTDSRPRIDITFTIVFFIAVILYYISIFKLSGNSTKKVYMVRYIIMWICIACFCYAIATRIYDDISNKIEDNNVEKWFYSVIQSRDVGWMILLTDILIPVWYAKLAVPTAYWVPKIIAYYAYDLENKGLVWICFSFSTLFMTMLWGMKNYHEWKNFEGRANIEAWDDVHRNILDKVPDAIAVIDAKAEIIYSNSTFKTLFQDSVESLSQKITECKRSGTVMFESTAHPEDGKSFHNPNLDETRVFYTFSDILHRNVLPLIQGRHKLESYITFSAKMTTMIDNEQTFRSYEIKLGSLVEYDKAILILTDVTQRELAISLETANQYKDKLLATVSHDLRAPINGSVSLIESTIEHEAVPEFIKEQFLIPAQRSCKFLLHLANDILDFSQINAQKLRMNFETNSLIETIKNCYHLVEMQANKKKIHYRLDLADDLPDMFSTDHNRLSQVIINLLTNAIKFTFSGSVTLSAHVLNDLIQIKVTDTGIGIKDKDKEKLFQEFTRIEYDKQDINTRGVGLGLVIANKLAKKLGPSYKKTGISLSSMFGQGSTFELLLEDKKLSDNDNQTEANKEYSLTNSKSGINLSLSGLTYREEDFLFQRIDEGDLSRNRSQFNPRVPSGFSTRRNLLSNSTYFMASPASQKKKRFSGRALVVDDDAINIIAFETILRRYGISIDVAYNGKQAVERIIPKKELNEDKEEKCDTPKLQLLTREYNIIFMDYEMPVMDGIEATKTLIEFMKNKEIYNVPIIGCTGHQDQEKHNQCLNSGMVDVITKPPMREKLLEILERYVGHSD